MIKRKTHLQPRFWGTSDLYRTRTTTEVLIALFGPKHISLTILQGLLHAKNRRNVQTFLFFGGKKKRFCKLKSWACFVLGR